MYDGSVWAELLEFPDGRSRERSSMPLCGGLTFAKRITMKTIKINATKEQIEKQRNRIDSEYSSKFLAYFINPYTGFCLVLNVKLDIKK